MGRYHAGELAVQELAGVRRMAERMAGSSYSSLPVPAQNYLQASSFAAMTWLDSKRVPWITPLSGAPGFLQAMDQSTIAIDLQRSAAPLLRGQDFGETPAALVVMDFGARLRVRVNGHASSKDDDLLFYVDEVYGNCPKYIHRRHPLEDSAPSPEDHLESLKVNAVVEQSFLDEKAIALASKADTFFIGTYASAGGADASHRGGEPGFVKADAETVSWKDFPGNNMFNTFGNVHSNKDTALLFLDFETREGLALTGTIESFSVSEHGRSAKEDTVFKVKSAKHLPRALAQSWEDER